MSTSLELLKSLTILYLEDEENIRRNVTKTLQLFCHNVHNCSNANDALLMLQNKNIDIILSDISMPKMNGIEFSQEVRKTNKYIPIILLTAHTDTHYLLEATKLKLIDYLTKPLNFTQLKEALIRAALEVNEQSPKIIQFENKIYYDLNTKQLFHDKIEKSITAKEISLLELLHENKDKNISHTLIKSHLWEDSLEASDSALKAILNRLRHKIGKQSIINISGVGYQLVTA